MTTSSWLISCHHFTTHSLVSYICCYQTKISRYKLYIDFRSNELSNMITHFENTLLLRNCNWNIVYHQKRNRNISCQNFHDKSNSLHFLFFFCNIFLIKNWMNIVIIKNIFAKKKFELLELSTHKFCCFYCKICF